MDSLTQIVTGAIAGEQVLGKKIGHRAALGGGIIGTIPDLDVFLIQSSDVVQGLFIHRGFSHSILFCLFAAPILGFLLKKMHPGKTISIGLWIFYALVILLTAVGIDYLTGYGASIFWPFSSFRLELNTIAIVDVFFTIPAITLLILTFAKKGRIKNYYRKVSIGFIIIYLVFAGSNKLYIHQKFSKAMSDQNISYQKLRTAPLPLTNFLWMGLVKKQDTFLLGYYSLFDSTPIQFSRIEQHSVYMSHLTSSPKVKKLIEFTKGWYSVEKDMEALYINDLRFGKMGISETSPFVFRFKIEEKQDEITIKQIQNTENTGIKELKPYLRRIFSLHHPRNLK